MSKSTARSLTRISDHPRAVATCAFVLAAAFAAANAGVASAAKSSGATSTGTVTARKLLVGARAADMSFTSMNSLIGPVKVTRAFYSGGLPTKFSAGNVTPGVKIIVSYKAKSANTAAYVKSIPAGTNVSITYHHEPEGPTDYAGTAAVAGATFVKEFDAEAAVIHQANPLIRVAFIAGTYQYQGGASSSRGIGGHFIPKLADDFYGDSYQRTTLTPAQKDPRVQNYMKELAAKGKNFNGFTEYGRGVIASGGSYSQTVANARIAVMKADAIYLATLPNVDVWSYWYTTDIASGDQWRFTDTGSINTWLAISKANA